MNSYACRLQIATTQLLRGEDVELIKWQLSWARWSGEMRRRACESSVHSGGGQVKCRLCCHDGSRPHMNETVPQGPIDQAWETLDTLLAPCRAVHRDATDTHSAHFLCTSQIRSDPVRICIGVARPNDRITCRNGRRFSHGPTDIARSANRKSCADFNRFKFLASCLPLMNKTVVRGNEFTYFTENIIKILRKTI